MDKLKIGDNEFSVGFLELNRAFRFDEKYRVTVEAGYLCREIRGVYTDYTLKIGDVDQAQYDALIVQLTKAEESQVVEMPYLKNGTIRFQAAFENISDGVKYIDTDEDGNDVYFWDDLTITFTAFTPNTRGL